MSAKVTGHNTL